MPENDGQERTEEATPRKRQEARRKGTVARSVDLTGACGLLVIALTLPWTVRGLAQDFLPAFASALAHLPAGFSLSEIGRHAGHLAWVGARCLLPLVGGLFLAALVVNFAQVGFVLSAEPLNPNLEKIDPIRGFKRLFSVRSGVEALKVIAKSAIFGWLAWDLVRDRQEGLLALAWAPPSAAAAEIGGLLLAILWRVALAWLAIGILDYLFQRRLHDKQLRMTRDELKRELREQEGSPEVRSALLARHRKLLRGRPIETVPKADVVITNPEHYAVALKYERATMHAPLVVAKGRGYVALTIREIARAHRVPIVPNPPLARQLYKLCEVGDFVPRELFVAVAEVLAYVHKTIKRLKI